MSSIDVSAYTDMISNALKPETILSWAFIIVAIIAPVLVIQFGLQLGNYIMKKLSSAFRGLN